jgi:hypothetical protein
MADGAYRLAAEIAVMRQAARAAAAMAHHFRNRPGAVAARMRALGRLRSGLGLATLPPAVRRPVVQRGEAERFLGDRTRVLTRRAAVANRAVMNAGMGPAGLRRTMIATRAAGVPARAKAVGAGSKLVAEPRLRNFVLAQPAPRPGRAAHGLTASIGAGPRLLARTAQTNAPHRGPSFVAPVIVARLRQHVAVPVPQQAEAPGFHRTVHQSRAGATVGDVYLDKALVGYHLAAAITAEQTRAAGRPSISGAAFNSSMAALRPAGAGL